MQFGSILHVVFMTSFVCTLFDFVFIYAWIFLWCGFSKLFIFVCDLVLCLVRLKFHIVCFAFICACFVSEMVQQQYMCIVFSLLRYK